jgi:MFS family permease
MKTVMWLYLFIFVAFFDLHAQFPMLTPFAISLGAAPSFIGFIMGIYSLTHLPGNLLAGHTVDRYGSKPFIVGSLIAAGILLILQGGVKDPWELLAVRSVSGFVLAFLSPACLALLARMARDHIHQGKLMSGNGLVHTLASVVSPAIGALLVSQIGFTQSFIALGWGLIVIGVLAVFGVQEAPVLHKSPEAANAGHGFGHTAPLSPQAGGHAAAYSSGKTPWLFFGVPLALSCSQGILFFELPLLSSAQASIMHSGFLFSIVSVGALITLSMLFLNNLSAHVRTAFGGFMLAMVFFGMAVKWAVPLPVALLLIGMSKGIIFPALATLLASITDPGRYGRIFSFLSIAFSIGAFVGPIIAGNTRDFISPYYIAFIILMTALAILPPPTRKNANSTASVKT